VNMVMNVALNNMSGNFLMIEGLTTSQEVLRSVKLFSW
jgi:hypothetical protein